MAPNPIAIPRKRATQQQITGDQHRRRNATTSSHATIASLLVGVVALLVLTLSWPRRWLLSGAAIESALVLYGSFTGDLVLPTVSAWPLLAGFNLAYAIASTSWLLHAAFTFTCYPLILLTCLMQFDFIADLARRLSRRLLRGLHFTRDKIALFNLPALEIDTDVKGLFVARGITISLSSLTIVAHGIELGLLLDDEIELSVFSDKVTIRLFRDITIGHVYGNIKGGKVEMTFADLEPDDESDQGSIFDSDTPLLRVVSGRDDLPKPKQPQRPSVTRQMTGGKDLTDSTFQESWRAMKTLTADDDAAEKQYQKILAEIEQTSQINQARTKLEAKDSAEKDADKTGKEMHAALCAELQGMPSVPHAPSRSIKVTTLQTLSPPFVRRFLHRLPFLLRLLLNPLGYFHPISIDSISIAGSGKWLGTLLKEKIFKDYASHDSQIRRLERKVMTWLADANFCLMLGEVNALGHVPVSPVFDIINYLHFGDIIAFRTALLSGEIEQIVRLGGADATITVPSFLLPHHEHLLPPEPTVKDKAEQKALVDQADGTPHTVQEQAELEKLEADETEVKMSVHVILPMVLDQSLLNFVAALVKATKVIEMDKSLEEETEDGVEDRDPASPDVDTPDDASIASASTGKEASAVKKLARGIRQNIKDGRTGESIKEFARDIHRHTKEGVKKAVVGGIVNDRWIAKMVGKLAVLLERAQGDVGYSGEIPVSLAPYRAAAEGYSKLLP